MAKAALVTAGVGLFGAVQAQKAADDAAEQAEKDRQDAADAAQAAKDEESTALAEAERKKRDRAASLATGGAASQFQTGPLGVTGGASTTKKTLLGS